jgi:hypothetical protein
MLSPGRAEMDRLAFLDILGQYLVFPGSLSALPHLFSILLPAGQALRPCTTPVGGRLLHRVDRDAPGVLLLSHLFGLQNRCFSASGTTVPRRLLPFESARSNGRGIRAGCMFRRWTCA